MKHVIGKFDPRARKRGTVDPNACADRVVAALNEDDLAKARDACDDLIEWLTGGGFEPDTDRQIALRSAASVFGARPAPRNLRQLVRNFRHKLHARIRGE